MDMHPLRQLLERRRAGQKAGVYSCCSANEFVLRAALLRAKERGLPALIEATANQVDQFGGYIGMTPAQFYGYVHRLAAETGLPECRLILGGDHLGPLTWAHLPEEEAMAKARDLVRRYARAGFTKLHLDTSMRLADDDPAAPLSDAVIARRGADLCRAAEEAWRERVRETPQAVAPVYVIGSEVPIPGGARQEEEALHVTSPGRLRATIAAFQSAFGEAGLDDAWGRVVAVVAQPGVEFSDAHVIPYDRQRAAALTAALQDFPGLVLEGHSTDYQTPEHLRRMVEDGVAILKVGPMLTFALREGLVALEHIEGELLRDSGAPLSDFAQTLEAAMLRDPGAWRKHYHGDAATLRLARRYSFSDRARYYLPEPAVAASIQLLLKNLSAAPIPLGLLSQYLPLQYEKVRRYALSPAPDALLLDKVGCCIDQYLYAITGE